MTTPMGHTNAIMASRVIGTAVYNTDHERIGSVEDVVLDKMSDRIMFAVLSFGGFLGIGERYHAVPWDMLDYHEEAAGYVVPMSREELEQAPTSDKDALTRGDGQAFAEATDYYARIPTPGGRTMSGVM